MSTIRSRFTAQQAFATTILLIALIAAWFAYAPGMSGSLHFDDQTSLGGLADVSDRSSALRFVFSGRAGPLGRPLALASFVPEASSWPTEPQVFLRTNIFIHLLNGVLVTWLLYLLGTAQQQSKNHAALIAAGTGAIWMLLPILASSTLFVVQRMTTLSAVFVLLGGIAYLYSRRAIKTRPKLALSGMTLALGFGAAFGVLAKENGALLPILVLAIETTLLRRPPAISPALWRRWFGIVLILPGVLLLAYLATRLPYADSVILRRNFTGLERLLTEAGILWKYLYLAFVPNIPSLGPFHDDYEVQRSLLNPTSLLAVVAWVGVILATVTLRRKAPLFAFAAAWYLIGHSLESTTISLELYFEHRNYLPLVGPVYALLASTIYVSAQWRRMLVVALTAYFVVLGGVLFSVTSLWGTPKIAAEMWYIYKPESIRAAEMIAKQMEKEGDLRVVRKIFRDVREHNPDAHHLDLQILLFSCVLEPGVDHSSAARSLESKLRTTKFSHSVIELLQNSYNLLQSHSCLGMDKDNVFRFGQSILDNPRYSSPGTTQVVHVVLAQIAIDRNDPTLAMIHIEEALSTEPDAQTLIYLVKMLNNAKLQDVAATILEEAPNRPPSHPIRAKIWAEEIDRLKQTQLELLN